MTHPGSAKGNQVRIRRFDSSTSFLDAASDWLLRSEAEHNLLLGLVRQLQQDDHPYERPIYLAAVQDGAEVVGCAFRTPPFKLGLTRLPASAVPLLVSDVAQVYRTLPAVLGPKKEATEFAELWTQRFGGSWSLGMRQRLHILDKSPNLNIAVGGFLREAQYADLELVKEWAAGFVQDTGIGEGAKDLPSRLIHDRSLYIWEDDEPRSMVAAAGESRHGVRIGYVYTPPCFRGCGYATAGVAGLSTLLLNRGRKFCCLYTDLANPTSNAIYQRVGYRALCDVVDANIV
jgi:hypothetical protein